MKQQMLQEFIRYAKDEFGFNIEVNESIGKILLKKFLVSFFRTKRYFDLLDINSLNYDNKEILEINTNYSLKYK